MNNLNYVFLHTYFITRPFGTQRHKQNNTLNNKHNYELKRTATSDSHYFPPSPISESGSSQTKPIAEHSSHFEHQYQHQRRRSHENLDEGYNQRPSRLQIDFSELNHEADRYEEREGGQVDDEQFGRVGGGEDLRRGGEGLGRGVEGHRQVGLGGGQRGSPVDYPAPDYCTPLVIKVIVLIMLLRIAG